MELSTVLEHYHSFEAVPLPDLDALLTLKAGVRGHPGLHPATRLLLKYIDFESERFLDATNSAGALALKVLAQGLADELCVLEPSKAALRCAEQSLADQAVKLQAAALWQAPKAWATTLCCVPSTDKGNARVHADLIGACRALATGGVAYIVMHKDQGAKRYEKEAKKLFAEVTVIAKESGWRLSRARRTLDPPPEPAWVSFEVAGFQLEALPGVYAAGKLDPGTAFLLETLNPTELAGKRVLDLGCGYGLLALTAARAGADVTALDDDMLAVMSTKRNGERLGLELKVLHSDVNSALEDDARFDVVLSNPPFHVGKQVRLDVAHAFIAAAHKHLRPGGQLLLVANKALHYEALLEAFSNFDTVASNERFKVLKAHKA